IYAARLGANGATLDPNGIPVSTAVGWQSSPAVAFTGSNYLSIWLDSRASSYTSEVYGARISTTGQVLDPSGFPVVSRPLDGGWWSLRSNTGGYSVPVPVHDGQTFWVVYASTPPDAGFGPRDVYAAPVALYGTLGPQVRVSSGGGVQYSIAAGYSPTGKYVM